MDRPKKKKRKDIVLSKDNLLVQPLALTLLGVNPGVIGNRVSIAIVRRLQTAFKEMISGRKQTGKEWYQLSIFDTEDIRDKYLGENVLTFDIHMNELVRDPKHYQDAFNAVCQLGDVMIYVPMTGANGQKVVRRVPMFTIMTGADNIEQKLEKRQVRGDDGRTREVEYPVYRYKKGTKSVVGIVIEKVVAEYIFNFQKLYGDFLEYPAVMANDRFFTPIYIWLSAYKYKNGGVIDVDLQEFRRIVGLGDSDKYATYSSFFRRIIKPAQDQMKELSDQNAIDLWFDVEKIYLGSKRAKYPDKLRFTIHLTDLGKSIQEDKGNTRNLMEVEKRLKDEFQQTPAQVRKIMRLLPYSSWPMLSRKMDELAESIRSGKVQIERSLQSYANVVFTEFAQSVYQKAHPKDERQTELFDGGQERVGESIPAEEVEIDSEQVADQSSQEAHWKAFVEEMKGRMAEADWTAYLVNSPMRLLNVETGDDGRPTALFAVPNRTFADLFHARFGTEAIDAMGIVLGNPVTILYKVVR